MVFQMRALILAGGKGTRLLPYTAVLPKPLMPIGETPILEIIIRQLKKYDISEIILSVGHMAGLIETFFGDGKRFGVTITYSMETQPLGTAGPIALIPDFTSTLLVMNGDVLTSMNYRNLIEYHKENKAEMTVGMSIQSYQNPLGYVEHNENNVITNYVEKPVYQHDVSMGIYIMEPKISSYIEKGKHIDIPELVNILIAHKQKVVGYHCNDYWLDMGKHDNYNKVNEDFNNNRSLFL
jgi:NDP-sugar pyrophosphorylase family protein